MTATCDRIVDLVTRIQQDFLDHPRLALPLPAAQMRFDADADTCEAVLEFLREAAVLTRTASGKYVRHGRERTGVRRATSRVHHALAGHAPGMHHAA